MIVTCRIAFSSSPALRPVIKVSRLSVRSNGHLTGFRAPWWNQYRQEVWGVTLRVWDTGCGWWIRNSGEVSKLLLHFNSTHPTATFVCDVNWSNTKYPHSISLSLDGDYSPLLWVKFSISFSLFSFLVKYLLTHGGCHHNSPPLHSGEWADTALTVALPDLPCTV